LEEEVQQQQTWPTPCARDHKGPFLNHRQGGRDLAQAVQDLETEEWPTPRANLGTSGARTTERPTANGKRLDEAVRDWPTATATDAKDSARHGYMITGHAGTTLLDAVREAEKADKSREYPTPAASSYGSSNNGCPGDGREEYATKGKPSLESMARDGLLYPTPTAACATGGQTSRGGERKNEPLLQGMVGAGKLNPDWVETLMGFPIGWTDGPLDPETLLLFGSLREP